MTGSILDSICTKSELFTKFQNIENLKGSIDISPYYCDALAFLRESIFEIKKHLNSDMLLQFWQR
jgi:hypothetical protein